MKPNTPKRPSVHSIVPVLAAAALALAATPAFALIACEDCGPNEPLTRCAGFCNGIPVWFCGDWYFLGCGNWIAPAEPVSLEQAEERFIRSLDAAPAEEALHGFELRTESPTGHFSCPGLVKGQR